MRFTLVAATLLLAAGRVEKTISQPGTGEQPQRGLETTELAPSVPQYWLTLLSTTPEAA